MARNSDKIEIRKIDEIIPYINNPRHNKEAVDLVAASISEFGFKNPIILDSKNVIVAGHTRFAAAKKLGLKEVPCIMADDLTEQQIKAFRLADNKVAEAATWDMDLLKIELDGITDIDMSNLGFDDISLGDEIGEGHGDVNEDDVPEKPDEPNTKVGDIYQLGKHRLICGDSTDVAVIDRLMDGVKADMVFTDPPYGIAYKVKASASNGNTISEARKKGCKNEQIENDDSLEMAYKIAYEAFSILQDIKTFYICCDWKSYPTIKNAVCDSGIIQKALIVWDKGGPYQHLDLFAKRHEFIIYAGKYGGEETVDTDIWTFPREFRSDHPTPKPIKLITHAIECQKNINNVLDIFGGSGSTLIACEQLNRKCYMAELDPKYCDVIIARWEKLTGKKAERIN